MEDIKSMMSVGKSEFGIPGYTVAKTHHYITKSAIICREPSKKSSKSREVMPDPTKYSPTVEKLQQTLWKTPNGKFFSSKKINFIEEQIKRSKSSPGPGHYLKELEKLKPRRILNGRFDKSERLSFLTTVESYAEETPCSWKYNSPPYKSRNTIKWLTPKIKSKPEKVEVGPGKYEGIEKAMIKVMTSSPKFSFPKSKTPKISQRGGPGVGTYKDVDKGFFKHITKRNRVTVITPYKIKGFTETIMKNAEKIPGPGAYNIIPPLK